MREFKIIDVILKSLKMNAIIDTEYIIAKKMIKEMNKCELKATFHGTTVTHPRAIVNEISFKYFDSKDQSTIIMASI